MEAVIRRLLALCVIVLLLPVTTAAQPAIEFGRHHALVIGNDDYRALPKLKTAIADARAVAELLRTRYGFEIELLLNVERDQVVRAIGRYRAALKDGDNLLIYYAGHGLIDEPTDRGFWLPIDADRRDEARWIDLSVVTANLRAMQARHILVIADSCFSGSLVRADGAAGLATGGDATALLLRMRERRARLALTSGSLEPVIDGGDGGHSVFAGALLRVLQENSGILSGTELFDRVRRLVVARARQTPLFAEIRLAGHEGGDFLLPAKGAVAMAAPARAVPQIEAAMELAFWQTIRESREAADFQAYLDAFPAGRFAPLARRRVEHYGGSAVAALPSAAAAPPPAAPSAPAGREPVADAAALKAQWPAISDRIRQQFDDEWAISEGVHGIRQIHGYDLLALDQESIRVMIRYTAEARPGEPVAAPLERTAEVGLRNRAPKFRIERWGALLAAPEPDDAPPEPAIAIKVASGADVERFWPVIRRAMEWQYMESIRYRPAESRLATRTGIPEAVQVLRYQLLQLGPETVELKVTYDILGMNSNRGQNTVAVRLRNDGPAFPILSWR